MEVTNVLAAGVATGTVLLFAAIGELFAERAGVLNLGVEGMMLFGAVAGFSTGVATGNPWLGVLVAMPAARRSVQSIGQAAAGLVRSTRTR